MKKGLSEINALVLKTKTAERRLTGLKITPIERDVMQKMAQISPGERTKYVLKEAAETKAKIKEEFRELYPDLSELESNMEVLKHLTPARITRKL